MRTRLLLQILAIVVSISFTPASHAARKTVLHNQYLAMTSGYPFSVQGSRSFVFHIDLAITNLSDFPQTIEFEIQAPEIIALLTLVNNTIAATHYAAAWTVNWDKAYKTLPLRNSALISPLTVPANSTQKITKAIGCVTNGSDPHCTWDNGLFTFENDPPTHLAASSMTMSFNVLTKVRQDRGAVLGSVVVRGSIVDYNWVPSPTTSTTQMNGGRAF